MAKLCLLANVIEHSRVFFIFFDARSKKNHKFKFSNIIKENRLVLVMKWFELQGEKKFVVLT